MRNWVGKVAGTKDALAKKVRAYASSRYFYRLISYLSSAREAYIWFTAWTFPEP